MRRYISTFILGLVLATPFTAVAKDEHSRRYYDRDRRDYHEWNERENRPDPPPLGPGRDELLSFLAEEAA